MAIIAFWSGEDRECGQTFSMAATATYMCVEHNYRTLLINANFQNDSLERCFWNVNRINTFAAQVNKGKIDIASGAEGLVSAIASNKTSPEIVATYTKAIFKNRLDVLPGLKTTSPIEYEKALMLYKQLLLSANKYYDFVFVDVPKGLKSEAVASILNVANTIVYVLSPNMALIEKYMINRQKLDIMKKGNLIPLLGRENINSKYNARNVARFIGEKRGIPSVPDSYLFSEAANEAGVANFFLKTKTSTSAVKVNDRFLKSVQDVDNKIIAKLKELQFMT
jgi:MinD-like ATPase involved in chromosome partitioning or flagellar assembly